MVTFSRDDEGVWSMTFDDTDPSDRNDVHDEAVVRYMTTFDKAFTKAADKCEIEFVKALLRIWKMQDAGWDPYETTRRAVPAMVRLHDVIPEGAGDHETSRHLALWTYGHVIEASEPPAMLADMLDIADGGFFQGNRFPDVPLRKNPKPGELFIPTRPQRFVDEKLPVLEKLATAAGLPEVLDPIREIWDRDLRNAVFHADYTIHGNEVRIPAKGRTYTRDEFQTLINRAIAYHEALAMLRESYVRGYEEPVVLPLHPDQVTHPNESAVVVVREGRGAIGLKHPYTAEEIAAGAIPWHLAKLYPGEADEMRADPTLAKLPARED
jgi:hypothetical protein